MTPNKGSHLSNIEKRTDELTHESIGVLVFSIPNTAGQAVVSEERQFCPRWIDLIRIYTPSLASNVLAFQDIRRLGNREWLHEPA